MPLGEYQADEYQRQFLEIFSQPKPKILVQLACDQFNLYDDANHKIEPIYLRDADTSKPKHKLRKLEKI
jgi:tRNA A37 threonylcarbamoyladenosine modification protein TsaB